MISGPVEKLRWRGLWLAGVMALTGCSGFFVPVNNSSGGGGGGSTSNLVYVANAATNSVSGFGVGTATLTSVPNMPYALGFTPQAAVVTVPNSYLYVAGPTAIYAYAIGSDGSLTVPAAGAAQVVVFALALDVSPDGNWLVALDGTTTQLDIYKINTSTGGLALNGTVPYSISNGQVKPKMVKVSADGGLVFAALGTGGDLVFTFNTSTGATALSQTLTPISTQTSDNALAVDSTTKYLYIARSGQNGGLAVYTIGAAGLLTPLAGSPFAAGAQPLAVVLDSTQKYAYVANGSDGTISGYSVTNGVATALSSSPYGSGATVQSLTLDRSGTYLLAAAFGGSPDLTMYSFDATSGGKLNQVATAATGTDPAGALLVTASH
jgi:6-phosphogluconolactonase